MLAGAIVVIVVIYLIMNNCNMCNNRISNNENYQSLGPGVDLTYSDVQRFRMYDKYPDRIYPYIDNINVHPYFFFRKSNNNSYTANNADVAETLKLNTNYLYSNFQPQIRSDHHQSSPTH